MPKSGTNQSDRSPVSISAESAMPERSAPMLIVFAMKRAKVATAISGLGNLRRNVPASPRPVTIPMRAHELDARHERPSDERRPKQRRAVLRTGYRVSRDARRIVIRRAGDQAGTQLAKKSP